MSRREPLAAALCAAAFLSQAPDASAQRPPLPDGPFVKGSGAAIYTVREGQRRWIMNPDCYFKLGGKRDFSDTQQLADAALQAIPEGPPVFCDGNFIKFTSSPAVYQVVSGHLRWFNDPACAFSKGVARDFSNVQQIDGRWEQSYGYGKGVCAQGASAYEARFIKGSGPAVYSVRNGQRRWIKDPEIYYKLAGRGDFSQTEQLADAAVNTIPEAAPLFNEGQFIKFPSGAAVYQVVSGHLRWLDNPGCAFARGVAQDWSNVFTADAKWERAFALGRSVCPPEGAERKPGPRGSKGG